MIDLERGRELCDTCGSLAIDTTDVDGDGNPLGHVQCGQCSQIADLEDRLRSAESRLEASVNAHNEIFDALKSSVAAETTAIDAVRSLESRLDSGLAAFEQFINACAANGMTFGPESGMWDIRAALRGNTAKTSGTAPARHAAGQAEAAQLRALGLACNHGIDPDDCSVCADLGRDVETHQQQAENACDCTTVRQRAEKRIEAATAEALSRVSVERDDLQIEVRESDGYVIAMGHEIQRLKSKLDAVRKLAEPEPIITAGTLQRFADTLREIRAVVVEIERQDIEPNEPPPQQPLPENCAMLLTARTLGLDQIDAPGGPKRDPICPKCGSAQSVHPLPDCV